MARPRKYDKDYLDKHWKHYAHFCNMHKRARDACGVSDEFSMTTDGFTRFVEYLGPIPDDMDRPTVGRDDHNKGYVRGNFKWQSSYDNFSESAKRNAPKFDKVHTDTLRNHSWKTNKGHRLKLYLQSLSPGTIVHLQELKDEFEYTLLDTVHRRVDALVKWEEIIGKYTYPILEIGETK